MSGLTYTKEIPNLAQICEQIKKRAIYYFEHNGDTLPNWKDTVLLYLDHLSTMDRFKHLHFKKYSFNSSFEIYSLTKEHEIRFFINGTNNEPTFNFNITKIGEHTPIWHFSCNDLECALFALNRIPIPE